MVSGNDAAVALAEFIGGDISGFATMMNQKALELGLKSTHFITPHGLDQDEHYTTAFELAILTDYALENSTFAKIVKTSNCTISIDDHFKTLHNTNELLGHIDGIYGVKTGFTNGANRCLVTSCKRGDLDIICVVLGCDTKKDRSLDSIEAINYVFNNFSLINLKEIINKNFEEWQFKNSHLFDINKGVSSDLGLYLNDTQIPYDFIAINNSVKDSITTSFSCHYDLEAPIVENTIVGKLEVNIDNSNTFSIDILNANSITRKSIFYYLSIYTKNYFDYFKI